MSEDDGDVVALLLRRHTPIPGLFDQVTSEESGEDIVAPLLTEEHAADRGLARPADTGTDDPEFLPLPNAPQQDALAHAEGEQRNESDRRTQLAVGVRNAARRVPS